MLTPDMQTIVAAEIANDPAGRGYGNLPADQQAALLNAPYTVPGPVVQQQSRLAVILSGQPGGPNAVSEDDVNTATQVISNQLSAQQAQLKG